MPKIKIPKNYKEEVELLEKLMKKEKKSINRLKNININIEELLNVKNDVKNKSEIVENIFEILPDVKLAVNILTSSILSPVDIIKPKLNVTFNKLHFPSDISLMISSKINDYFKEKYNIIDKLQEIIEESLFTKGGYFDIFIPSNYILDIYNKKIVNANADILSSLKKFDKSTIKINNQLEITTNPSYLIINEIEKDIETEITAANNDVYDTTNNEVLIMSMLDDTIGKPIIKKIPIENVIPLTLKNEPKKHLGYFIILDGDGNLANLNKHAALKDTLGLSNNILSKAKKLLDINKNEVPKLKTFEDFKSYIIKEILDKHLGKLSKTNSIDIDKIYESEVIDIVLDKILNGEKIKLMYVDKSLGHYFAYRYRENGTGKSLLEDIIILSSMLAMSTFVSLMANVKSSIPTTVVNVTLDEDDPNYEQTMERIMTEVVNNRQLGMPLGLIRYKDLVDWLKKIGFAFNFKHPGLPNVEIEIEDKHLEIKPVETEFKDEIRKRIIMALGLPPEIVDKSYDPEFATSIVIDNMLLAKRILTYQTVYNKHLTEYFKKVLKLDANIKEEIKAIIEGSLSSIKSYFKKNVKNPVLLNFVEKASKNDLIDFFYHKTINSIVVTLPEPIFENEDNDSKLFDSFTDKLDKVLEIFLSSDALPSEITGEISDKIDSIKTIIKTVKVKKWMSENNILPEISDIFELDDMGRPMFNILEEYKNYLETLSKTLLPFLKETKKISSDIDEKLNKLDNEGDSDSDYDNNTESDSGFDNENENNETETENEDTGSDEFGTDFDTGEEETTEESSGEENTEEETTDEENSEENSNEENTEETGEEENTEETENNENQQ